MSKLTHIQMAVHLQSADLLAYCSAEQVMRLAGIAHQRRLAPGEAIYQRNDPPAALYCVVEGSVLLTDAEGRERQAGIHDCFGVREILSDRLRREQATSRGAAVLEISANDFFDLLSNNIEIVKALFRRLLGESKESAQAEATASTPGRARHAAI